MCDTPIARITGSVSSVRIYIYIGLGGSPCNYSSVVAIRVNRVMLDSLFCPPRRPVHLRSVLHRLTIRLCMLLYLQDVSLSRSTYYVSTTRRGRTLALLALDVDGWVECWFMPAHKSDDVRCV